MKLKYLLLLTLIISFHSFGQELEQEININIDKKADVFQIVNTEKKEITLFFVEKDKVKTLEFSETLDLKDSLVISKPSEDYDQIKGYSISENGNQCLYWANSKKSDIIAMSIDMKNKTTSLKPFQIDFQKERVIKELTVKNVFYIITALKNTNTLNLYSFNNDVLTKKTIDLGNQRFFNSFLKADNIYNVLAQGLFVQLPFKVESISNETPASLALSINKRKIFQYENNIRFTFDNSKKVTQVLNINLDDFSFDIKNFEQPKIVDEASFSLDSNSFLLDNELVQLTSNPDKLIITISNLNSKETKTLTILKDEEVTFKNSEIIQETNNITYTRILDKSNQLLRKISNLSPGLSCYKNNGNIFLTLGGVSIPQNNTAVYGGMFGMAGALLAVALTSNYSLNNVNSYLNRKVVYVNCLFDENFNHKSGDINRLSFDKLRLFMSENEQNHSKQTVFKINNSIHLGCYDKKIKKYMFYKFVD